MGGKRLGARVVTYGNDFGIPYMMRRGSTAPWQWKLGGRESVAKTHALWMHVWSLRMSCAFIPEPLLMCDVHAPSSQSDDVWTSAGISVAKKRDVINSTAHGRWARGVVLSGFLWWRAHVMQSPLPFFSLLNPYNPLCSFHMCFLETKHRDCNVILDISSYRFQAIEKILNVQVY